VGVRTAEAVAAFIDDPRRFRDARAVGRYFGMFPSQDQSWCRSASRRVRGCRIVELRAVAHRPIEAEPGAVVGDHGVEVAGAGIGQDPDRLERLDGASGTKEEGGARRMLARLRSSEFTASSESLLALEGLRRHLAWARKQK
jgi:hypothetical protein